MKEIIDERYPSDEEHLWRAGLYWYFGNTRAAVTLTEQLLPMCQFYAYVEIVEESARMLLDNTEAGEDLWQNYRQAKEACRHFEMQRVSEPGYIYPTSGSFSCPR